MANLETLPALPLQSSTVVHSFRGILAKSRPLHALLLDWYWLARWILGIRSPLFPVISRLISVHLTILYRMPVRRLRPPLLYSGVASGQYSAWAAFYGRVWENMGKYESVWECLAAYVFRLRPPSVYFRYLPLLTVLL